MTQNAQTYGQNKRWVRLKVDPADLPPLMKREDARPFRDMFIWLALMGRFVCLTCLVWGSWYAVIPLYEYAVSSGTSSVSEYTILSFASAA